MWALDSSPPPPGIPEEGWCKNRLQQYTQKASIALPVYETKNEGGAPHAPQFRSRVWVDGTCFQSPNAFSNRKMAEQDAAKHALIAIQERVKNEGHSRVLEILQDTVFCKMIIHEYVSLMNLKPPTYVTNESKAVLPLFVCSLILNGATYVGDAGKNKKEAEQFAARAAILSILDTESGTTMSEIVKSKFKLYNAMKPVKDSSSVQGATVPAGVSPSEERSAVLLANKRKEVEEVSAETVTDPSPVIPQPSSAPFPAIQMALSESNTEQPSSTQNTYQSLHEFKKPEPQTSSVTVAPPIVFVPPAAEHTQMCATSGRKQKRKNKKARKNESLPTDAVIPQTLVPAGSAVP
ncbi:Double-stranded RNA-binding protein 4 [Sesamum alatum]|uniref:Double-stranded RNA-binding protein 4 n=1 Tax=Sesamum alatum TaxID=300844 RepID=A0AAE1XR16_9LAMI|nr:Double-stranded RNA-binding protein 4 [Sesamum alatum]